MSRTITAAASNAATGSAHRVAYLISIESDSGTALLTSAAQSIDAFGLTFIAVPVSFTGIRETPERKAQGVTIEIEGINPARIATLLTTKTANRIANIYVAQFDSDYKVIADPTLIFRGYLNGRHNITTVVDPTGVRYAVVSYDVESPQEALGRRNGIRVDVQSHQARFSGDTIFRHALADSRAAFLVWGEAGAGTKNPIGFTGFGTGFFGPDT